MADPFKEYLKGIADEKFPFPGYREYQDEMLYEALEEMFINGTRNIIIDGPTGIGKSPLNVTLSLVAQHLAENKREIEDEFGVELALKDGSAFYTTPQKSLRDQLANDDDLADFVTMLKARRDYICAADGDPSPCDECDIQADPDDSCRQQPDCTYWQAKFDAMAAPIAALTFAMLIVDKYIPEDPEGRPLSFGNRDMVIVDEGHKIEQQSASLFAGFSVSPYTLPSEVFGSAGSKVDWDADRFEDVEFVLGEVAENAKQYISRYEDNPDYQSVVEDCENYIRKYEYCKQEIENDRPWVVNIDQIHHPNGGKTKKIELKPVDVDDFLKNFVWSRGRYRVISSATIPYRDDIDEWADRLGLDGDVALISRPMPFPEENRLIHTSAMVGSMSGDDEDRNWKESMNKLRQIHRQHKGEKGLVHTNSYARAERVQESLGKDVVMVQPRDKETEEVIKLWQEAEQDILVSPTMVEGVDLYEDRCRWQVLLKVPYPYVGDSRVSYLLNERNDWTWYMESASMDIQQSVGRAVRGPEDSEAASYYVIDESFDKVIHQRTNPPGWFMEAITDEQPEHWADEAAAPWRQQVEA